MDPVLGLSLGRIVIGIGSIASPSLTARMFGLSPADNPQMSYFTRMFGVREIALGSLTLLAKGDARRTMVLAGMAVDGADAATGVMAIAKKEVPLPTGGMLIAVALGAVGSGAAALAQAGQSQT
ncbi:DUF4267 domain-containing protein [Nocardioides bizhenqiangii]|uniref:DUF4267 domain-containing protein n=1 Tax=Nocardioides bizhenqiangii TaxID=3095076 RepID=A0ABZ0ZJI2_9ACTN|nr:MULTISPECIES: DUF4267 domain-containing protein [unclassified Nocardioides]MDZ5620261.1 DUF4267 domain-containing protein [Nocardioides sp. HM23]WQQ24637.1 DUF4267 domain-containing protein [Nocardioides sp. HM61]